MLGIERLPGLASEIGCSELFNPRFLRSLLLAYLVITLPNADGIVSANGTGVPAVPSGLKEMCGRLSWNPGTAGTKYYFRGIESKLGPERSHLAWWPIPNSSEAEKYTESPFYKLPSDDFTLIGVSASNNDGNSDFVFIKNPHNCEIVKP